VRALRKHKTGRIAATVTHLVLRGSLQQAPAERVAWPPSNHLPGI